MPSAKPPASGLDRLASRLEQDIRRRGLWAGDRYLSTAEAAKLLHVSMATAHRALRVLVRRRMLVRHRSRGTFVGPHFKTTQHTVLRTVCAVMPPQEFDLDVSLESFVRSIRSRVAGSNVQIHFLPPGDVQTYVQGVLHSSLTAGNMVGFVPIGCSREVYRRLADSGVPTVIYGTPYADQQDIPSIDVDHFTGGRLLTEYLTGRGHRRMVLFRATEGLPGDDCFYDGVSEALTAAKLPHNGLIVRVTAPEPAAVAAQLARLLALPKPPTAVIAWTPRMTRAVAAAVEQMNLAATQRCEIVYQNNPALGAGDLPFTHVQPRLSEEQITARIGEMLEQLGQGRPLGEPQVVVPVDLCEIQKGN
jgi:DNA-binding LacI/PurR family transcriptional regulator